MNGYTQTGGWCRAGGSCRGECLPTLRQVLGWPSDLQTGTHNGSALAPASATVSWLELDPPRGEQPCFLQVCNHSGFNAVPFTGVVTPFNAASPLGPRPKRHCHCDSVTRWGPRCHQRPHDVGSRLQPVAMLRLRAMLPPGWRQSEWPLLPPLCRLGQGQGLCSRSWLLIPWKAMPTPAVWAASCCHVGVQGPRCQGTVPI